MEYEILNDKVIMVVDNNDENFRFIEASLRKTNAQVIWARNGSKAFELCKNLRKIDLVLMDVSMPEMNGYEATMKIREIRDDIPIFIQTAYGRIYNQDKRMSVNFDGYVEKPLKMPELVDLVGKFFKNKPTL